MTSSATQITTRKKKGLNTKTNNNLIEKADGIN